MENLTPWGRAWDNEYVTSHPACTDPLAETKGKYLADLRKVVRGGNKPLADQVPIVYTAMHGVGYEAIQDAFAASGLRPVVPTPEQVHPDPTFPTVRLPNPEEGKGALTLAFAAAEKAGSTVVLANDPDADRLAVAAKHEGAWKIFTGNEIGAILGSWAWETFVKKTPLADKSKACMLSSTVSSMVLKTM
jgi:phosphomannomutase